MEIVVTTVQISNMWNSSWKCVCSAFGRNALSFLGTLPLYLGTEYYFDIKFFGETQGVKSNGELSDKCQIT